MICKDNQSMIDTLLRLKTDNNDNNKIASIMSKSHNDRTKEEKEDLCVHVLNQLMDKKQNKLASVQQSTSTNKIGELAEFQSLLKAYIH